MKNYKFSIIIPVRSSTDFLKETLHQLKNQTYKNYEVIVVDDKLSKTPEPSKKRNLGAKLSTGEYLAFLDDDSYPDTSWLYNLNKLANKYPHYAAFCGPCLTPPNDNIFRQVSGLVWSSFLGSGGAGVYRNSISPSRFVDDYPTVNLIVKKTDFILINGFQSKFWPGEDTILCLDLISKLHKKIFYHPTIVVFHHRRNVLIPHLKQISRYALHRGLFARIYPETSFRLGYLLPSLFLIYLVLLLVTHYSFLIFPLYLYLSLLAATFVNFLLDKHNIFPSFLASLTIPITHLYYGFLFIIGFFSRTLQFKPHKIDKIHHRYVGG
jgi:glycosyltransferase involved in cell wall biosynthesis